MNVSPAGRALIEREEGLRLMAYPDPGSEDGLPATIGYGHTTGVKIGETCTQEQAFKWLTDDLYEVERCIEDNVTVELTQGQFDALADFVFNVGERAFKNSTLLRLLNAGNPEAAEKQFARWNRNDGVVMAGLTRRRAAEAALFVA